MVKTWTRHKTTEALLNNGWRLLAASVWRLVAVGGWWHLIALLHKVSTHLEAATRALEETQLLPAK